MLLGIKRIYEKASIMDGRRILIDGLWPRGVKRSTANVDEWMKDVAPTKELRQWFSHDPAKWESFKKRYERELERNEGPVKRLVNAIRNSDITLIYSSNDEKRNNAVVLVAFVKKKLKEKTEEE